MYYATELKQISVYARLMYYCVICNIIVYYILMMLLGPHFSYNIPFSDSGMIQGKLMLLYNFSQLLIFIFHSHIGVFYSFT